MLETRIVGRADRAPSLLRCADLRLQSAAPTRIRRGEYAAIRSHSGRVPLALHCTAPTEPHAARRAVAPHCRELDWGWATGGPQGSRELLGDREGQTTSSRRVAMSCCSCFASFCAASAFAFDTPSCTRRI